MTGRPDAVERADMSMKEGYSNGKRSRVGPEMPDHPPDARYEKDLYQFVVGPAGSDTRAEYLLPVQEMNETGLLKLIEHPEILAVNWGESA